MPNNEEGDYTENVQGIEVDGGLEVVEEPKKTKPKAKPVSSIKPIKPEPKKEIEEETKELEEPQEQVQEQPQIQYVEKPICVSTEQMFNILKEGQDMIIGQNQALLQQNQELIKLLSSLGGK